MLFDILTLFPEMFPGVLGASIFKRAADAGQVAVRLHNIRDYAGGKHRVTDDYPYGGGVGMVMKPEPIFRAVEWVYRLPDTSSGITQFTPPPDALEAEIPAIPSPSPVPIILTSPQGRLFKHSVAEELAQHPRLIIICGHYEGFDERILQHLVTDEISVGDYVLTGGELPAMVITDAVARLQPGVLAEGSAGDESHARGLLEYPQYTRPPDFRGWTVPPVLISGHHKRVDQWRRRESLRRTLTRRPDLLESADLTAEEKKWLVELEAEGESGDSMRD
jgi:tRNA (guanine37-N1)-methyltransferase